MRVLDSSVLVEMFAFDLDPERLGDEEWVTPHLADIEVLHALRGIVRRGELTEAQGNEALDRFIALDITRFPGHWLRHRIWGLRHNLTAYDANYVALAEVLDATLITTDARMASGAEAASAACDIEIL